MNSLKLDGDRLFLREISESDITDDYLRWMNDLEVTKYLESRFHQHSMQDIKDYVNLIKNSHDNFLYGVFLKSNERHIGNIKLGPISTIHRHAEIGLMIGEKDCWGLGYATEAIKILVSYAFSTQRLNKLTAGCYATNIGSKKAFESAGFIVEGVYKKHFFCDGKLIDSYRLGILNREIDNE